MERESGSVLAADPDWWRGAVICQITPRSNPDSDGVGTIFCAFNPGDTGTDVPLPEGAWQRFGTEIGGMDITGSRHMTLGPWQFCLANKMRCGGEQNGRP